MSKKYQKGDKMEKYEEIERTIITTYRKTIWAKFIKAITTYKMIQEGDKIAVCISGGKDSMLLAKCLEELKKHGKNNFELEFIVMNPGYQEANKQKIIQNSKILNIPITMFETDIFARVEKMTDHECYLCARMRRGYLYKKAQELGCNKIALGHHFDDVIETVMMGIIYAGKMQTMMPKLKSTSHPGMELIRPLYFVKEEDIISWKEKNNLDFIKCACKITQRQENSEQNGASSKREEIKELIQYLKTKNKNADINIFNSTKNINLDTIISYKKDGKIVNFLDEY